ncbi:MAG: trimeric autotransporter adhesin, partial [Actinomycetota bacterium]|nr:trimeric autotransporter adhesin [Actinomycetota bacterium]
MHTNLPTKAPRRTTIVVAVVAALVVVAGSVIAISSVFAAPTTPTPTITSGPANPTNATAASFTFTDSASGATFECALDGDAFAACVSPKTYPGPLANGVHTFSVRANKTNATVSSVASLTWRVDTVAPALVSINRAGANPASVGPLSFTVTFAEPVTGLALSNLGVITSGISGSAPSLTSVAPVGSAPSATWTANVATTGTTAVNGTIGLNLTSNASVKDAAGNPLAGSLPVAGQVYGYDTTKPTISTLNRADANPTNSGSLHWTATFSETVANVVGANFGLSTSGFTGTAPSISSVTPVGSAPTSAWTVTVATSGAGAAHGTIRLDLTAKGTIQDAAANALQAAVPAAGQTYDYDSVSPAVTLTKVNGNTAAFPLSTTANLTSFGGACGIAAGDSPSVYVSITGAAIQSAVVPCTASATWSYSTAPTLSATGTYRVTATQPDTAGNTGSSGERTVVIDRTPPPAAIFTNTPEASTDKTNAQFNWYDTEGGVNYQCALDGA